jgi:hypothetical protein
MSVNENNSSSNQSSISSISKKLNDITISKYKENKQLISNIKNKELMPPPKEE